MQRGDMLIARPRLKSTAITDSAKGETCTLGVPGCIGGTETTVACHSPRSAHGRALGRKADDFYIAYGCVVCHDYLDGRTFPTKADDVLFDRGNRETLWRLIEKRIIIVKGWNA